MGRKLYVGNLPFSVNKQTLQDTFSQYGTVDSVNVITDRDTGQCKGFAFVDHLGNVYPSGFLPIAAGSCREASLIDIYRDSTIFRDLRNPELLKGKCGVCEYKAVCAGSRARAYALSGDPFAADPFCAHIPADWVEEPAPK